MVELILKADLDSAVFIFYIREFSALRIEIFELNFSKFQKGFVNQSLEEFISRCKECMQ